MIVMPLAAASSAVAREVGTHRTFMPAATSLPTPSVKYLAVEPLPSPSSMPSCTSSSAFSAAALLSSSDNGVSDRLDSCLDALLETKHRVARDQHCRAGADGKRGGSGVDAAIDLDLHVWIHRAQAADLLRAVRDELLAAEAGLHGHHVDHVDVREDLAQGFERGRRVDGDAGLRAELLDSLHRAVQRRRRLDLHLDQGAARFHERLEEELGVFDHQVDLDRELGRAP